MSDIKSRTSRFTWDCYNFNNSSTAVWSSYSGMCNRTCSNRNESNLMENEKNKWSNKIQLTKKFGHLYQTFVNQAFNNFWTFDSNSLKINCLNWFCMEKSLSWPRHDFLKLNLVSTQSGNGEADATWHTCCLLTLLGLKLKAFYLQMVWLICNR